MTNIINYCRMLLKPRIHQRFSVKSGTFVIVSPGTDREQRVQVIDISLGGTAFIYQGSPEELEESGVLKILAEAPGLAKVNFDTVSDRPTSESLRTTETFRRRGVKFKWMGVLEQAQLKSFIKEVGIKQK
jgi:c-di-GMP-binding flagellar brake protein YcgR